MTRAKKIGPLRLKVNSPRNSECGSTQLWRLDFSQWWTEGGLRYIHVAGPDDTFHRVFCRHTDEPRLALEDGILYWLVDR